jgi:hypothetical protein
MCLLTSTSTRYPPSLPGWGTCCAIIAFSLEATRLRDGGWILQDHLDITSTTPSPAVTAVSLFLACATWEVCQLFDFRGTPLEITRGRFDPFDLLAYGATQLACYFGEQRLNSCLTKRERTRALTPF